MEITVKFYGKIVPILKNYIRTLERNLDATFDDELAEEIKEDITYIQNTIKDIEVEYKDNLKKG